jgi:mevalonate kinase
MNDYSEAILESSRLLKQINTATLKRNFELAHQLTESLNFVTQELSNTFRKLDINDKH